MSMPSKRRFPSATRPVTAAVHGHVRPPKAVCADADRSRAAFRRGSAVWERLTGPGQGRPLFTPVEVMRRKQLACHLVPPDSPAERRPSGWHGSAVAISAW